MHTLLTQWRRRFSPMMEANGAGGAGGGDPAGGNGGGNPGAGNPPAGGSTPEIDYDKLASLIQGKQQVTEDTIIKNYLKQQGITGDEAAQAIAKFKDEKAKNTPDIGAMQSDIGNLRTEVLQEKIKNTALLMSADLGIDLKTMPYVLKMANLSDVTDKDGGVDSEKLKTALNKVLEDVPALKSAAGNGQPGFKVGANGGGGTNEPDKAALAAAFGIQTT